MVTKSKQSGQQGQYNIKQIDYFQKLRETPKVTEDDGRWSAENENYRFSEAARKIDKEERLVLTTSLSGNASMPAAERKIMDDHGSSTALLALADAFIEVALNVPALEREAMLGYIRDKLDSRMSAIVPPLPAPDLSGGSYELFHPRTDPIHHLERVWGQHLSFFNSRIGEDHVNHLTIGTLTSLDPRLCRSLRNAFTHARHRGKTISIGDIVVSNLNDLVPKRYSHEPAAVAARSYR